MENGMKCEVVTKKVQPYEWNGMTLDREYVGRACVYENGKKLFCNTSSIRRVSKGGALKDAHRVAHDLAVTKFFNEQTANN